MRSLDALLTLLALDSLPRTGWILAGVPVPESIAGHSHGTALLVLALGPRLVPPIDVDRAASLATLHDTPEALIGDLPRPGAAHLPAGAKRSAEDSIAGELLGALSELALERYREYAEGRTPEARFAAVCDGLHLGLRLLGYQRAGQRGLEGFKRTLEALDCSEFPPCAAFRDELLGEI